MQHSTTPPQSFFEYILPIRQKEGTQLLTQEEMLLLTAHAISKTYTYTEDKAVYDS